MVKNDNEVISRDKKHHVVGQINVFLFIVT